VAEINFKVLQSAETCFNQPGRFSINQYITITFVLRELRILLWGCLTVKN